MSRVTGVDEVVLKFRALILAVRLQAEENVTRATRHLHREVKKSAGLTDHTLAQLAQLGHPYARRRPQAIHSPSWLVHRQGSRGKRRKRDQGGTLYGAIQTAYEKTPARITGIVGIEQDQAPHAKWIVYGTSKMISRDFLTGTFTQQIDTLQTLLVKGFDQSTVDRIG